jgi:hypothetical protein
MTEVPVQEQFFHIEDQDSFVSHFEQAEKTPLAFICV